MNRVSVLGIGLGVGMALGTFFGRVTAGHLSDTAFDALGNWLAAIGTVGAVIVALLVAQREVLERARDRDAAVMREYLSATRAADEREARARAKQQEIDDLRAKEERDALSVECWARWGSTAGSGSAPDTVDLTSFRATVKNPTLVDLTFVEMSHPLFGIGHQESLIRVEGTSERTVDWALRPGVDAPSSEAERNRWLTSGLEVNFVMHGRHWRWTPTFRVAEIEL